jgi:cellulose synthase/poly-beta-1,6-N-acetylglucosamine synthase-like glycosyltransferase
MLYEILVVVSIIYFVQITILAIAVSRAQYPSDISFRPRVSIIIAARNEEENIGRCLDSVVRLTYPHDLLEVIVVDDRSTDRTHQIVGEFTKNHPQVVLAESRDEEGHLRGKTNAVVQGIDAAKGEILMFTDADCTVKKEWVEETVKYYSDNRVGIVAGFTLLRADNWFGAIQALDWLTLFSAAAGFIRIHSPVTAVGNNLSVRRKAYEAVGGYRKIPFSVTEDYALVRAVTSQTEYSVRLPLDQRMFVESKACTSWKGLYRQKMRWFTGGKDMEVRNLVFFGVAYLLNLLLLIAPWCCERISLWIPLSLKVCADLFLSLPALSAFAQWRLLVYFLPFQLYYILYVVMFPILVLMGTNVVWKDRTFAGSKASAKENAL